MKIISLKPVTPDFLISSTLPASSESEWSSSGTYSENDIVKVSKSEDGTEDIAPINIYKKTSTSDNPYPPNDDGTNWLNLGATNRWAMFDQYVLSSSASTVAATSTVPSEFTVEIDSGNANYIGLFNLNCSKIYLEYKKSTGVYQEFNETNFPNVKEIQNYYPYEFQRDTQSWLDYLFGDFIWKRDIVFPIQWDKVSSIRIKFENSAEGQFAECGMCVVGQSYYVGETQYGASSGILSFSRKDRNEYTGYTYLKKGNSAKKMDIDVMIDNSKYNRIHSIMSSADGLPIILQGNNSGTGFEPFMVYGFLASFDMTVKYPKKSLCTIEAEGLI